MSELYYINEFSLEDSFVYKTFNNSNDILTRMVKALKTGIPVTEELLEEQFLQLKKSHISSLSKQVLEAYYDGLLEINYSTDIKIPTSLPFIIRKKSDKIIATIFLSSFGYLNTDTGSINISTKNLYVLLESAYIGLCIQSNPLKISRSTTLERICNEIYTYMVLRILNKSFALSLNQELYNQCIFVISKFFLTNIWGNKNPEVVYAYALSICKTPSLLSIQEINDKYEKAQINDISDLIYFLKDQSPRLKELNIKEFIERYINTYGASSILSLDYLPYLFFVIINVLLGAFLISTNAASDIIKNDVKKVNLFYPELSKIY